MIEVLRDLPSHVRSRLSAALESGALGVPCSMTALATVLGRREGGEAIADALAELARLAWIPTVSETLTDSQVRSANLRFVGLNKLARL